MRHAVSFGLGSVLALGIAACSAGSPLGGAGSDSGGTASGGKAGSGVGAGGTSGTANGAGKGAGGSATGGSATGGSSSGGTGAGGTGAGGTTVIGEQLDCPDSQIGSPALRLLTRRELENTLNDIFPSVAGTWSDTLPANSATDYGFDNDAAAAVNNQMVSALYDTALSVATAVTGTGLTGLLDCAGTTKDHACAQGFVEQFGRLLFRRPLSSMEETRYLTLFDSGLGLSDFPTALKWVIAGMIQSPYAVYRSEIGNESGGTRTLTPYEVATELAYTFGGTAPSSDLLAEAESATSAPGGQLTDLSGKAKSLLQTKGGRDVVQHFFEAYLAYNSGAAAVRTLTDPAPDSGLAFADVAPDMVQETQAFISDVVVGNGGGLIDLLTQNTTYPSKKLAQFYKFPTPPSADYASVERPAGQGIGVLAQGSFLSSHANVGASSPTQRGLFVYYRLMCQPKTSPPKGVPPLPDATTANTTRELYEKAHAKGTCANCHQYFDPLGFGFENFDQGGRFRTTQNGYPVDPAAKAIDADGNTIFTFSGEEELAQGLAAQAESYQCLSAYLSTYAFGSAASCLGPTLKDNKMAIVDAYAALADEKNFTQRNPQ